MKLHQRVVPEPVVAEEEADPEAWVAVEAVQAVEEVEWVAVVAQVAWAEKVAAAVQEAQVEKVAAVTTDHLCLNLLTFGSNWN